jgi:hypothetical protein
MCAEAADGLPVRENLRLPPGTTIGLLKVLCSALFGCNPNLVCLKVHSGPRAGEEIGGDNTLDILYWNLAVGDVVSVSAVPAVEAWQEMSGSKTNAVPKDWILPPEFQPELAGMEC